MSTATKTNVKSRALFVSVAVLALIAGIIAAQWWSPDRQQAPQLKQGTWLPEPRELAQFDLKDHQDRAFGLDNLRQHWSLVFFGYTHCPDVCPTTMTTLQQTAQLLKDELPGNSTPQYVFVSVDPERDSPKVLAQFVGYFGSSFIGVTGNEQAIKAFTSQLGIAYSLSAATADGDYAVNHSASILLINPQARLAAVFSPPHGAEDLAYDLAQLAGLYENQQ